MVFPNPASTDVKVEVTKEALEAIELVQIEKSKLTDQNMAKISIPNLNDYSYIFYNKEGNIKLSGKAQRGNVRIDVSTLKRGIYFLEIDFELETETHELLIN